ncbi:hypothetical protein [Pseudoxanthomonas winnipegensis]|uniref:hypothetical protein n=1 Tax=Pseudoxanthomonas winnipegensis TaxID=2480810 RepID=UPI00103B4F68|nr:hypothetical protein [Pseudoxanthomonas winnipegensis]TBV69761.1 hypothetical protein EYC45_19120 [Pseudoxanthomonas winnipegensis]
MSNIHHPHPPIRLAAAKVTDRPPVMPEEWPLFWHGVSNPWLVFLGPSPGNSPGEANQRWPGAPTLGAPHPHVEEYVDSNGFWERIRSWTTRSFALADVFTDPDDALSSVLVGNVLDTSAGDASKLPKDELRQGLPRAARMIRWLQPRLVVTMHKGMSEDLVAELMALGMREERHEVQAVPARKQVYENYRPQFWDLRDDQWGLRIVESPQHPTKRNFYDAHVFDEFLAQHIRELVKTGSEPTGA